MRRATKTKRPLSYRVVGGRRIRVCPDGHKNLYDAYRCSTCGKVLS